jgi:hypothetical protein
MTANNVEQILMMRFIFSLLIFLLLSNE